MADQPNRADFSETRAWLIVGAFMLLFLVLLVGVPLFAPLLASTGLAGLTWGHWLFAALHILPVIGAWVHIRGSHHP